MPCRYFGYVFLMSQSEKLEKIVKTLLNKHKVRSICVQMGIHCAQEMHTSCLGVYL